jgi:hypothetical protein
VAPGTDKGTLQGFVAIDKSHRGTGCILALKKRRKVNGLGLSSYMGWKYGLFVLEIFFSNVIIGVLFLVKHSFRF